ncbi:hypothetical protein C8R44DRAFT_911388 [Mycena epipterygia]|nr:hypothetical protein C8R44DRAFT_911388 [Mycena epipterygia]
MARLVQATSRTRFLRQYPLYLATALRSFFTRRNPLRHGVAHDELFSMSTNRGDCGSLSPRHTRSARALGGDMVGGRAKAVRDQRRFATVLRLSGLQEVLHPRKRCPFFPATHPNVKMCECGCTRAAEKRLTHRGTGRAGRRCKPPRSWNRVVLDELVRDEEWLVRVARAQAAECEATERTGDGAKRLSKAIMLCAKRSTHGPKECQRTECKLRDTLTSIMALASCVSADAEQFLVMAHAGRCSSGLIGDLRAIHQKNKYKEEHEQYSAQTHLAHIVLLRALAEREQGQRFRVEVRGRQRSEAWQSRGSRRKGKGKTA